MKLLKLILIVFGCMFLSCEEDIKFEYKYADRENLVICEGLDTKLFQEALYSFEEDIFKNYDPEVRMYNRAYSRFIGDVVNTNVDYNTLVSEHTKSVFDELKKNTTLWDVNNRHSNLNHKHDIIACIAKNINDEDLKETFNALINANSMSVRMFKDQLKKKTATIKTDRYLALFVALDYYYANLHDVDFTKPKVNKTEHTDLKKGDE